MKNKQQLEVVYPAVFTPEINGGYLIEFPDIQGAFTGINTNDLVMGLKMAEEVLGMVCADYLENGDKLRAPSAVNQVEHAEAAFVTLVKTDVAKYLKDGPLVKKTLAIPTWANQLAQDQQINFSALLTKAIAQELEH